MDIIRPQWPAPARVQAATSTRQGGVSAAPYQSLNLGGHVGDQPAAVAENRSRLAAALSLPGTPHWLSQVHGTQVARLDVGSEGLPEADASTTTQVGTVCAVLTADCLPVLMCDRAGTQVAAAHAGWRGLAAGVLEVTVASFAAPADELLVWLGPAIGPSAFEVGDEVRETFVRADANAGRAFELSLPANPDNPSRKWLADLYLLARQRLARSGVQAVYGGGFCTFTDSERFYSFRRDGVTGRMASLIWISTGEA